MDALVGVIVAFSNVLCCPLVYKGVSEPFSIISSVSEEPFSLWQAVHQGSSAGIVADLTCGDKEADWAPTGICYRMQFGVHDAFDQSDQATTPPFFNRRLPRIAEPEYCRRRPLVCRHID
jgi:hypothetical protein